ncbi:ankyrin repeat domain-containing protein [Spirochaeta africana]|uniref:Ankyrin repeat-containing protein n=1 Tax=Spirochaeta africana (strain ATCC 700263 / DSM 8902 / Z-7692) TaxID=889378 RepID=H9UGT2_SPIAZ|nr:ankyrin repeat domain-containing protein [Spirochaeta africana]AFG36725.1 ankyrin repeat-containing protein [Spirochaeta africana DSM 8902]
MRTTPTALLLLCLTLGATLPLTASVPNLTPNLHRVARWGQAELVELLLENGADTEERDIMDRTALHHAARHPRVVRVLVEADANPNARDRFDNTPLHMATIDYDSVRLLIAAGADVNAANSVNRTPLDIALRQGTSRRNREIVRLLIEAGAR